MSWTVALSGPKRTRAVCELALQDAGLEPLHAEHPQAHALIDWAAKYPDEKKTEWIAVVAENVNLPTALVADHGWRLRVHYATPEPPEPSPEQKLAATLAEMQAEIAALRAKVG